LKKTSKIFNSDVYDLGSALFLWSCCEGYTELYLMFSKSSREEPEWQLSHSSGHGHQSGPVTVHTRISKLLIQCGSEAAEETAV